jgi:hypothetical protein
MRKFYIVFFIVNLFLSYFYVDIWTTNSNTASRALPIISFFENGTLQIDKYQEPINDKAHINGHYYTDKAPLPTFIVLPFFGLLKAVGLVKEVDGSLFGTEVFMLGSFITGSLPFVLFMLLAFFAIAKKEPSVSQVFLVMMPFYGSFIFVFAGTYFAHIMSAFLLLVAYLFLKDKKYILAGLFSGLAFLSEYTIALVFPIWALQVWIREKSFYKGFLFGLGTMPSIIFILIYNYIFTGSPFEMLYKYHTFQDLHTNYGFNLPSLESIWGLTFSDYKGLFFYTPFLFLAFAGISKKYNFKAFAGHYLFYVSIVYFLVVAAYFGWWGGWTYGPRLLFPVAVLLVYEGIVKISDYKFSAAFFWVLTIFGLAGAFLAKITVVYSIPTDSLHPFQQTIFPAIKAGSFNPNNLATIIFGINPALAAIIWIVGLAAGIFLLNSLYQRIVHQNQALDI